MGPAFALVQASGLQNRFAVAFAGAPAWFADLPLRDLQFIFKISS